MKITKLNESTKKNILNDLLKRSPNNYGEFTKTVEDIVNNVRENGDKAVFEYTKKFDGVSLSADNIIVTDEEIQEAYAEIEKDGLVEVIRRAKKNITEYISVRRLYAERSLSVRIRKCSYAVVLKCGFRVVKNKDWRIGCGCLVVGSKCFICTFKF